MRIMISSRPLRVTGNSESRCWALQDNGDTTGTNADPFMKSLSLYLQGHKFQNTIAADLLSAFDEVTGAVSAGIY